MTTLTEKEMIALKFLVDNGLDAIGGQEPQDLLADNCSWFDAQDLMSGISVNRYEAGGIMSALDAKALIFEGEPPLWYVTEAGINLIAGAS